MPSLRKGRKAMREVCIAKKGQELLALGSGGSSSDGGVMVNAKQRKVLMRFWGLMTAVKEDSAS